MVRTMADVHRDEGIELGRKEALIKQLKTKFTKVPAKVIQKIRRSHDARLLDEWLGRVLTASTLDEMEILPRA